jgi:ABC-type sugar transport system ATPase subunit
VSDTPILEVEGLYKSFGAVRALGGVGFTLGRGEVLAVLGDNGAGKSTLVKCIAGTHQPDAGRIRVDGHEVAFRTPRDARDEGIEMVYQDLALFGNLSAAQNFYAGRELVWPRWAGRLGFLRERKMAAEVRATLDRLGVGIPDIRTDIAQMSGGQRQAIAVARAVAFVSKIVILDEPTAALGMREGARVHDLVRLLVENGVSVILISHNMQEITDLADRAIVLRRGQVVGEEIPTPDNHARLVSLIVGAIPDTPATASTTPRTPRTTKERR